MPTISRKPAVAVLVAAIAALALCIPPVAVPWATGHFHLETYEGAGNFYDGTTKLTLWGSFSNAIPARDRVAAIEASLRFNTLLETHAYKYSGPEKRPCFHVNGFVMDSTGASTVVDRARSAQAMVIIMILAALGNVAVAGLRVAGTLKRRPAIIATAVLTFFGLGAGIGAIVAWHLMYTSCGSVNMCEVLPSLAIELATHVPLWWQRGYSSTSCNIYAGLPVLAIAMAGFIVVAVLTAVTKDSTPGTDAERVGMVTVNPVYSDTELEEEAAVRPAPAGFVPPPVPPVEKRPEAHADYNIDDDPYAADYA